MQLDRYQKKGNEFFEQELNDYRKLGLGYTDFWLKAFDDFIRFQVGGTDQGIAHCKNVEHNIWKLIGQHRSYIPHEMLYVLSLSCALHDCAKTGKVSNHAVAGAEIIQKNLVNKGYVQRQGTADAIAWIVLAHDAGDFSHVPDTFGVGGDVEIRLRECAAIFRLADMMDTCEDRAARFHKMFALPHVTLNQFLNDVRLSIEDCQPSQTDRTSIEVRAYANQVNSRRNIESYVNGLNRDITSAHAGLLQNIKIVYLTRKKFLRREKAIALPYKFALSWLPSFSATLPPRVGTPPTSGRVVSVKWRGVSRLVPCYFINTETNVDIDKELLENLKIKKMVDPRFLYWNLTGTKAYLALVKNPLYILPDIAHSLLVKSLPTQFYPIIKSSGIKLQQVIDLGIGDGAELNIILGFLLSDMTEASKIQCSMVDISYHMLRIAVNTLDAANLHNENYRDNVVLNAINGDFRNLHLYRSVLSPSNGSRLFAFLGGTLGNFFEREVIEPIAREMFEQDSLLLGIDLVGDRSDEDLTSAYDSIYNWKFLFTPLADLGYEFEQCTFRSEISNKLSEVPKSKTIVSWSTTPNEDIQVAISTKYNLNSLKEYLETRFDFHMLDVAVDDTGSYAILLLRK